MSLIRQFSHKAKKKIIASSLFILHMYLAANLLFSELFFSALSPGNASSGNCRVRLKRNGTDLGCTYAFPCWSFLWLASVTTTSLQFFQFVRRLVGRLISTQTDTGTIYLLLISFYKYLEGIKSAAMKLFLSLGSAFGEMQSHVIKDNEVIPHT